MEMGLLIRYAGIVLFLWLFWATYVLVMGLYRAHLANTLTGFTKLMAAPIVVIGYLMDVFSNIFLATIVFLELPREILVTTRLKRHISSSKGWRYDLAKTICDDLLDPFDPSGNHC